MIMGPEEIKSYIKEQRNFFNSGKTLNVNYRIKALKKLRLSIIKYQNEIFEALKEDLGKSGKAAGQ